MAFCTSCGKEIPAGVKFCNNCGNPQNDNSLHCPNCGKTLEKNEKFCSGCGTPVSAETIKNETKAGNPEPAEKKGKYTKEGKKIIDSGPKPNQFQPKTNIPPVQRTRPHKKKKSFLRYLGKSLLITFIVLVVGVIVILILPDEKEQYDADQYRYGIGVDGNQYKAFELYKKQAKKGDLNAMIQLSDYYEQGIWVKKDTGKARQLLKKAADAGSLPAKWQLEFLESQK